MVGEFKVVQAPLSKDVVLSLRMGDRVRISGVIYSARDAAHKRLVELIQKGEKIPIDLEGQVIYYMGPSPAKPNYPVGSAGPTTSGRMDPYAPLLMERGLRGMIGKGPRSEAVKQAMQTYGAVYFAAVGGAGALISKAIISSEVVAYPELGAEAIRRMEIRDFPAIVAIDAFGADLYEKGREAYALGA